MDIKKQGLASVKDKIVQANLMGVSEKMNKKGWTDSQGRKGKVSRPCRLLLQLSFVQCLDNPPGTRERVASAAVLLQVSRFFWGVSQLDRCLAGHAAHSWSRACGHTCRDSAGWPITCD